MKDFSLSSAPKKADPNAVPDEVIKLVDKLSEKQLMTLRHHLDNALQIEIGNLNLTEELGLQYRQGKDMLANIMKEGDNTPTNQKAQVFNSVQAQLEKIVRMRASVFSQERLKRFEAALLKVLEMKGNEKEQELFLELYGDFLRDRGQ